MDIASKAFDWDLMHHTFWETVADEFIPVALDWRGKQNQAVLDLGCGLGRNTFFMAELGFTVTAVDLSTSGIERLVTEITDRNLGDSIQASVCDMLALPFGPNTFDCVLAFHSIYHTDLRGLRSIISAVTNILKDDGEIFVTFNSKQNPSFRERSSQRVDEYTMIKREGPEEGIAHTFVDYEDILDLLSGLKILRIQHIQDFFDGQTSWHYFVKAQKRAVR